MENKKKAIFIDIDGTLYSSKLKDVPSSAISTIEKLNKTNDFDLYIASGRSLNTINNIKKYLTNFKGFILTNGQEIYINNEMVYKGKIQTELVKEFVSYCDRHKYSVVLLNEDSLYFNMMTKEVETNFENYIKEKVYPIALNKHVLNERIPQMWLFTTNDENDLIRKDFPMLEIINWGNLGADVLPFRMSKAEGIKKVIALMNYSVENTFAIGDSDNDVEMFKVVGTSICMGNGTQKAKNSASYIGEEIDNDGFKKNIEKYVLKTELD